MTELSHYQSPLSHRYASAEMSFLFSPRYKFTTWRKLWIALAEAQKELGLSITETQIAAMKNSQEHLDLAKVKEYEHKFRHDVMAHLHAFADACPEARGIIHLGATSCYLTDNTDLLQMREALKLLSHKILQAIRNLSYFAEKHRSLPCLSYTHLQPAQPTTVGKRACLWIQDLLLDFRAIEQTLANIHFLGVKGATGTQASFLTLFDGASEKVKALEQKVAAHMGFDRVFPISGQTYTRKQDIQILSTLASLAASSHKFATDVRILAHLKEIEEPFGEKQIGSSAMPYKHNPMRSERLCSLARFLISLNENPYYTEATQWLERTLDDSAGRRLAIPEAFLTADAILTLICNITEGLVVHPKIIEKHLNEELPFLATELILMHAAKKGKDRQTLHERLRVHSNAASQRIKGEGLDGNLLEAIAQDPEIGLSTAELQQIMTIDNFIGRSVEQTQEFLSEEILPLLKKHEQVTSYQAKIEI